MNKVRELIIEDGEQETGNYMKISINDYNSIMRERCYDALGEITAALENEKLNETDCIEELICIFERLGVSVNK